MKVILWTLSLPHLIAAKIIEVLNLGGIRGDLTRCLELVRRFGGSVPEPFVYALVIAEDHRNALHPGIDPIAMMRALWVRAIAGQIQGASTIEQQFVRTVTNRYHRTLSRKLREQMLALILSRRVDKTAVCSAYLSIAFYGPDCIGIKGLKKRFGNDLSNVGFNQALWIVTQLKYPCPRIPTASWNSKMSARMHALMNRIEDTTNMQISSQAAAEFRRHISIS